MREKKLSLTARLVRMGEIHSFGRHQGRPAVHVGDKVGLGPDQKFAGVGDKLWFQGG
jgi:hypothetical protein